MSVDLGDLETFKALLPMAFRTIIIIIIVMAFIIKLGCSMTFRPCTYTQSHWAP